MRIGVFAAAALIVAAGATPVLGKPAQAGFLTSQASMLTATSPGGKVVPIITVGDMVESYRFESIPDGISFMKNGKLTVDLYVNHETSTVPFPLANNGVDYVPTNNTNGSQNDFDNSQVSKLRLDQKSMRVLGGSYAIPSSALFQRFCSNFLATSEHGFDRPLLLTNEEGVDWVSTTAPAFPAFPGDAGARQIGAVVAYDVNASVSASIYRPIWGMGRLNHENSVAIPNYGQPVVLTTDDTFTTTPSQSQLYSYIADTADDVWNDEGELWAFVSDDSLITRYEDFAPGETDSITGQFLQVPKLIATGRNPDGSELMADDVPASLGGPYDPPPSNTTWQRFNGVGIDGPQWVLETWSQLHDVFDFVRLEDVAYDKRPGMSNVVYLVDSGRGAAPGTNVSTNGRIWEMVLDPNDPTEVDSLRILIEGDDRPVKDPARIHQPDNIESTPNGLYITEDPGSQQNFPFGSIFPNPTNFDARATNARIWQYRLNEDNFGELRVVAVVDQSADEDPTVDVDPVPAGTHGFWEASGIIDASSVYGPGAFLVTIQAHSLWIQGQNELDNLTRSGGVWSLVPDGLYPDWINKREGGQLVLLRIPGG